MSAGFTTAPIAKKKIKAIFAAAVSDPTQVHLNHTVAKHLPEENVYVCDIIKGHREWKNLGRPPLTNQVQEDYQVICELVVLRIGSGEDVGEATEDRIWEIVAQLEQALAQNASLDGLVQSALPGDFELVGGDGPDGWEFTYTFAVVIEARI